MWLPFVAEERCSIANPHRLLRIMDGGDDRSTTVLMNYLKQKEVEKIPSSLH